MTNQNNNTPNVNNPYINNTNGAANANNANNINNANANINQGANMQNQRGSLFSNTLGQNNTQRDFIIGALIGAAASFILTNKNAQTALLKGFAKLSSLFEMGVEELKERYEDAKAEVNS